VKAFHNDRQEALHHLVAEMVVRLALPAQARGINADRADQFDGTSVEPPAIGRDKPGSPHDLILAKGRKDNWRLSRSYDLKGHPAVADQEEFICRLTFAE
jgi:hypothetical protein